MIRISTKQYKLLVVKLADYFDSVELARGIAFSYEQLAESILDIIKEGE